MSETIQEKSRVKISYTVQVDGKVVESHVDKPVEYVQGEGVLFLEIEEALVGKSVGDEVSVTMTPQQSFGQRDPKAVAKFPLKQLPEGKQCVVGELLAGTDAQGQPFKATVQSIEEDHLVLDLNHPYAGKELLIQVKIIDVKPAK